MVAACINAETGVGPSMASGSQTWSGNWADLPTAPAKRKIAPTVKRPKGIWPASTAWNNSLKLKVPAAVVKIKIPIMNPKSPVRVVMNAFLPASEAIFFSNQKPIKRYEVKPTSSQKTNSSRKLLAITNPNMEKVKSDKKEKNRENRGSPAIYPTE